MKKLWRVLAIASITLITSCASVAPTTETYTGYRIYHVSNDYTLTQVRNAVVDAAKELNNNAQVVSGIPPHPMPEKPGRFKIKDMAFGPVSMQFPQTPGATVSVRSGNDNSARGTSMNWVAGIYLYKDGYSVQLVMTARHERGASNIFDPAALGAALARATLDSQDGGIEGNSKKWFDIFADEIGKKLKMELEEAYPQG
ncbi:hypothetical protein [Mariprofundus sp. EBB-1]|uniref:hypothetical protein n=1 Tax=Mariprofundus sp. EBB-1 TaxID=2650971 RepID=UPI0011C3C23F|nr:hypothetical protein [Mariprofundus sp. EBB-1]